MARQRWLVTTEDHSFRRLLTQTENGGELIGILGADAIHWATRPRHSRGAKAGGAAPTGNYAVGLRHSGGAWPYLWRTEFSSVKKGRFSEDLSAFRGRTLGILGAHNPICTCTTPSSRMPAVCGNVGILRGEPRRRRQGKDLTCSTVRTTRFGSQAFYSSDPPTHARR